VKRATPQRPKPAAAPPAAEASEVPAIPPAAKKAPAARAPRKRSVVVKPPVEEAPVEESSVEESPVEETSVEETPVEETPVEETPVAEPVEPSSVDDASTDTVVPSPSDARSPSDAPSPLGWAKRMAAAASTRIQSARAREVEVEVDVVPDKPAAVVKVTPAQARAAARKAAKQVVLSVTRLTKRFDETLAVDHIDLEVKTGAFYGIVGPNGAGKTTTLSMITGLLRPTEGSVTVHGSDVWADPAAAKRNMGVLPDRLRLFDRLTGAQLLYYAGVLRGLDSPTVRARTADLAGAFGLEDALGRLVSDYSAGMTKKVALAAAMIHSPRLLVLDEPFESVDPVSAATVTDILKNYVAAGGTVVLSSHSMDLVQRICDNVAVVVHGRILADGTMASVRNGRSLEDRFVELAGGRQSVEGLEWLHSFSD
jgi:ABC-2 type transport system ATP-binding protein